MWYRLASKLAPFLCIALIISFHSLYVFCLKIFISGIIFQFCTNFLFFKNKVTAEPHRCYEDLRKEEKIQEGYKRPGQDSLDKCRRKRGQVLKKHD